MKQLTPELCVCTGSSWIIHVHQSLLSPTQSKPSWRLDSIADFIHLFPYQTGSYLPGVDFPWRFCWIMCPVWILWMIVVGRARPRALSFSFFCSLSHPVWLTGRLDSINKLGSTRNNCMRVCVETTLNYSPVWAACILKQTSLDFFILSISSSAFFRLQ